MDPRASEHLDAFVAKYRASAPEGWIRLVHWTSRLADEDGTVDPGATMSVEVAVVDDGGVPAQQYFSSDMQAIFDLEALGEALDATEPEAWTRLEIEIDVDGPVRLEVVTEPARPVLDSASDEFYDGVHDYLNRNRAEVEAFHERVQQATKKRGRLFGR